MEQFFHFRRTLLFVLLLCVVIHIDASRSIMVCEPDTTNDIHKIEEIASELANKGEFKTSVYYWVKYATLIEQSPLIDKDELSLVYSIIMFLAPKAQLFSTDAKYSQKFSRLEWPQLNAKDVKEFEKIEKHTINALIKAKDNDGALMEINYADSCVSSIDNYDDTFFMYYLTTRKHLAYNRYDLAYRKALEYLDLLKRDTVHCELYNDMREIADIMATVCDYEKAISLMHGIIRETNYFHEMETTAFPKDKRVDYQKIGDYYLLAKDYQKAELYYMNSYSIDEPEPKIESLSNGDLFFSSGLMVYDEHTSASLFKLSFVEYKVGKVKEGDKFRDIYLGHIKESGKKFIGDYSNQLCMLSIARLEALGEYDEAIKITKNLIKTRDESFGSLSENLALLYLKNNQNEEAFLLSTEIIKSKRNTILDNLEALTYEEKARLWNGNLDIFKIQKTAAMNCSNSYRESILFDDVALFAKGLLLTVSSNPDYKTILKTTWTNVQNKLKDKELAIEFIAVDKIDHNRDSVTYIAIVIDKMCKKPFIYNLCIEKDLKVINKAQELYNLIWAKIGIADNVKSIYFSADGILHRLPIEVALQNTTNYKINIYRLTSTRELINKRKKKYNKKSVLYGGLKYEDNDYEKRALRYSDDEVLLIKEYLVKRGQDCIVYQGSNGTCESLFLFNKQSLSFLHIATHGYLDKGITKENSMMNSGLVMSDRKISSEEIAKLSFDGIKLVVLSACGSGLGEITNGEGVFGLQRAFKQAGATSILMTLWDVKDNAASEFMGYFYKRASKGDSLHKALKKAQKHMKEYDDGWGVNVYEEPEYWAGFVLLDAIGD